MRPVSVLFAALVVFAAALPSRASVVGPPAPLELYSKATEVFVGRVRSVGKSTMQVDVLERVKGTASGTVEVSPIYEAQCVVGRDDELVPMYSAGQRILVAGTRNESGVEIEGERSGNQDLGDDAGVARAVAYSKEMIRIGGLDTDARRAAMAAHLMSEDPAYVEAVVWFQFSELSNPEQSRPHAAALVKALRAPLPAAQRTAARALVGVAAPGGFERLRVLSRDADVDLARDADAALAAYDTDEAVEAVLAAARDPNDGGARRSFLVHLGLSPRESAHAKIHEMLWGTDPFERRLAYLALGHRFERLGGSQADEDDLLSVIRLGGIAKENPSDLVPALVATKSLRVAKALVEIVRDPETGRVQRSVAYHVLYDWASRRQVRGVLELLRAEEALFVERLRGGGAQLHLFLVLGVVHTDEARRAVEWAEDEHPDENARQHAERTLDAWDDWILPR